MTEAIAEENASLRKNNIGKEVAEQFFFCLFVEIPNSMIDNAIGVFCEQSVNRM